MTLEDYFISPSATLRDAIVVIDRCASQIALVTSSGRLLGIVTDGDVRRFLLCGGNLDDSVSELMCTDFTHIAHSANENSGYDLMREKGLRHLPMLDERGRILRLLKMEDVLAGKSLPNKVVIMAGGEGRRLRPLTNQCPKPMLRLGNKPILEKIIENCMSSGFREFYISVNYLGSQISDYFGDGSQWGASIHYLHEQQPLGTAGALSLIEDNLSFPFLVLNADVLTDIDYERVIAFHQEENATLTVCVHEYETKIPFGVVGLDGTRVLSLTEKPVRRDFINSGVYVLNPGLLSFVPKNQMFNMTDLIEKTLLRGVKVSGFPIHEYWLDVGHPQSFELALERWS